MERIDLAGTWSLRSSDGRFSAPARVPGSVIADLLAANLIPDPYDGENEYAVRELFRQDFVFSRGFEVPAAVLVADSVELVCEGLDTLATVVLNGTEVATCDNMHVTWRINVRSVLREGANRVEVRLDSPIGFIEEAARRDGAVSYVLGGSMLGAGFLRKAHSMFGWDWGPQLPDAGIWRAIGIEARSGARIASTHLVQAHSAGSVKITGEVQAAAWRDAPLAATVTLEAPDGRVRESRALFRGTEGAFEMIVDDPRLWWPAGYGEQPLYDLVVTLECGGETVDVQRLRVGLRTLELSRGRDEWGEEFCFVANGVKIFALGANYIPEDSIIARTGPGRTRSLLRQCRAAHFNCIRVWGGGYYPPGWFFDACDELGLVVWLDLMFACNVYRLDERFEASVVREVEDNLARVRHHACLGLVCGNNEMELAWVDWPQVTGHHPSLRADYTKLFDHVLPRLCRRVAPGVPYWPSSPSSGGSFDAPNDPRRGDVHYWEVWHRQRPLSDYRRHVFRFCSEFGFQSFPSVRTVESFARPEDMNIFSRVMESHQKNGSANGKILWYLADTYRYPGSFRTLVYASQLLQADAIRTAVEHWRRNRGRCMGTLYWQVNDCWPVASWSSIDYHGRWKPLHYAAARFYAPVLLSADDDGARTLLHVTNETRDDFVGTVSWFLRDNAGRILEEGTCPVAVAALSSRHACTVEVPASCAPGGADADRRLLQFRLESGGTVIGGGSHLFVPPKHFRFLPPQVDIEVSDAGDGWEVLLRAGRYARAAWLELAGADAHFSDNLLDLYPGEAVTLKVARAEATPGLTAAELRQRLVLLSVQDL